MSKIKEQLPKKQKEVLPAKQSETLPATQYENPWLEAAAEAGNEFGKLLKFVKGKWETGDDEIADGTEYVAHINQLMRGMVKFEDGKVVDRVIGKIADNFKPPKREDLSDYDSATWREKDADGKPRDPWCHQWYLPLVAVETGTFLTFVTGSNGGDDAIADLCRVYGHKQRDGLLPIVALKTGSYKHKQYGRIETPEFAIVGWERKPTVTTEATEATAIPVQPSMRTEKVAANADMSDEIPF